MFVAGYTQNVLLVDVEAKEARVADLDEDEPGQDHPQIERQPDPEACSSYALPAPADCEVSENYEAAKDYAHRPLGQGRGPGQQPERSVTVPFRFREEIG